MRNQEPESLESTLCTAWCGPLTARAHGLGGRSHESQMLHVERSESQILDKFAMESFQRAAPIKLYKLDFRSLTLINDVTGDYRKHSVRDPDETHHVRQEVGGHWRAQHAGVRLARSKQCRLAALRPCDEGEHRF